MLVRKHGAITGEVLDQLLKVFRVSSSIDSRQTRRSIQSLFVLHTGIQWEYLPQVLGFGSGML
ncbi:hypothetical protein ACWCQK_41010 [Streptomyces sp. NPDC002306]